MKNKLLMLSKNIAKYSFLLFICLYSIANLFFTTRHFNAPNSGYEINYFSGFTLVNFITLVIIGFMAVYAINKKDFKFSSKKILSIFLIASFLMGVIWIFSNPQDLVEYDDAFNCYRAAVSLSNGDLSPIQYGSYINTYPHNLPLVTYFLIIIKIFGNDLSLLAIRFINLLFVLIGYYSLYKICEELYDNEKTKLILVILMFLSTQYVFYSFMIYSNVIAYSTGMVSLLYFLKYYKNDSLKDLIFSLLMIVFSSILKNNSLIILIAEIIFLILKLINNFNFKPILILAISLFTLSIFSKGIIGYWSIKSNTDYSNKLPFSCWIAYGVNYDRNNPGGYTNEFENFHHENGYVAEYTDRKAKEFIENSLNRFKEQPDVALKFYIQKFLFSYANPEYDAFLSYKNIKRNDFTNSLISGQANDFLFVVWDACSSLVSIGLIVFAIKKFNDIKLEQLLLGVCVFGGFMFHFFWETKSIYLYQYFLLLLPYAAYGISCFKIRNK